MRLKLTCMILAASLLFGQEKPASPENTTGYEATVIPIKTLTGDSFNRLQSILNVFRARITGDPNLRTIVVYASKDVTEQVRKVIAELDRPGSEAAIGRNIEMTLTFLRCSMNAPPADAKPLPLEMEPVAKQLRAATQYKDIQLWDTIPLRLQEGKRTSQSMRLPGTVEHLPSVAPLGSLDIDPESVSRRDTGVFVRFSDIRIYFKIPYPVGGQPGQFNYLETGIRTAGDFKEGQKSVIGKVNGVNNETVFVVIALKVLD
jgi:hypothetical protein